jgi:hypothetical protein
LHFGKIASRNRHIERHQAGTTKRFKSDCQSLIAITIFAPPKALYGGFLNIPRRPGLLKDPPVN